MKHLMYLIKKNTASWDIDDHTYELTPHKPVEGEYKVVLVEVIEEYKDLDELWGR